jgi:hypothetical protein
VAGNSYCRLNNLHLQRTGFSDAVFFTNLGFECGFFDCGLRIADFGFWIGGIASLYPLIKQAECLKSKIRNLKSQIIARDIIGIKTG